MEAFNIEFKPDIVLPKKRLTITDKKVCWGEQEIYFSNIKRIKYNATTLIVWVFPIKTVYEFIVEDTDGKKSKIMFAKNRLLNTKIGEQLYESLANVFYTKVISKTGGRYLEELYNGKNIALGKCRVDNKGVYFKQWLFGWKERFIGWDKMLFKMEFGALIIYAKDKKNIRLVRSFRDHWETWELYYILNNIELNQLNTKTMATL